MFSFTYILILRVWWGLTIVCILNKFKWSFNSCSMLRGRLLLNKLSFNCFQFVLFHWPFMRVGCTQNWLSYHSPWTIQIQPEPETSRNEWGFVWFCIQLVWFFHVVSPSLIITQIDFRVNTLRQHLVVMVIWPLVWYCVCYPIIWSLNWNNAVDIWRNESLMKSTFGFWYLDVFMNTNEFCLY